MIKKLKIKMILLSMISLFILLFVVVLGMNVINHHTLVQDADDLLLVLSEEGANQPKQLQKPKKEKKQEEVKQEKKKENPKNTEKAFFSTPSPVLDKNRYFSVSFDESNDVIHINAHHIVTVDDDEAIEYGKNVLDSESDTGFFSHFRYLVIEKGTYKCTIFLDCEQKLLSARQFLLSSILMAGIGFLVMSLIIIFLASKMIQPIAESYEKQKRFITDAGHEMKTPLTVIHANADLLETEIPENECLADIKQQTKRLTTLTNDLMMLSRMEESETSLDKIEIPLSEIVLEAASFFRTLADSQQKKLRIDVEPLLTLKGNGKGIEQLVSILMDNALKYSPKESEIALSLKKQNRSISLTVTNTIESTFTKEELSLLFDRFYRSDSSRNSETGGYGIGLSIAKAIVTAHEGTIRAVSPQNGTFQIIALFPKK